MATLTEVSFYTRRIIKWSIIVILIVMITPFVWRLSKRIYLALWPPPPPPPTVRYGILPRLGWDLPLEPYKPQMRLETIRGVLPTLPNIGRVYFVETSKSRILALDKIKAKAKSLGFVQNPVQINDRTYKFTHSLENASLVVDIISDNINYKYDWEQDTEISSANVIADQNQITGESKSFFQNLGLLPGDISDSRINITYLTARGENMIAAIAPSEANFVRADLYRIDRDNLKFVTSTAISSPINITFGSGRNQGRKVILANYNYSKTLDNDFATYPLKPVQSAWEELIQGGGYIAKSAGTSVVVRSASLAYFEPDYPQRFLQPVYVFEGDGGFTAYVQAVAPEYVDLAQPK